MLGSKAVKADQYSKLIDLVSSPEALTKRLAELKEATAQHEEAYQKAILAKEQAEDANKSLNERANLISNQLLEREKEVVEAERQLAQKIAAFEVKDIDLAKREREHAQHVSAKEANLLAVADAFNKREAESKRAIDKAKAEIEAENKKTAETLRAEAAELEHRQKMFAAHKLDLARLEVQLAKRENELAELTETIKNACASVIT